MLEVALGARNNRGKRTQLLVNERNFRSEHENSHGLARFAQNKISPRKKSSALYAAPSADTCAMAAQDKPAETLYHR
jgi:hypothetical protein